MISVLASCIVAALALNRARAIDANTRLQGAFDRLENQSGELTATTKRLEFALVAAEDANRAKSTFLANMSHELRTPLNAILGYAQLFKRDRNLSEWQAGAVGTIRQSGEHLLTLISDILDLSKIEAGRFELAPSDVDLPALLRGVADIVNVRANEKSLSFVQNISKDLPRFMRVDERRLRQVLLNLLGNAVKFTDSGCIDFRVEVVSRGTTKAVLRFEVRDTGVGIAEDNLEAIFRPFEQVCDPRLRSGGTGLGLSISRELLRLMGSEIQLASEPGTGSRFWFEISLPVIENQPVGWPTTETVIGYLGPRRSALIVDDTPENRAMLADTLRGVGFEIHEAANGLEGLERAYAVKPDLILIDVMMPVMDGLEAMRRIRQTPDLQSTPIIAVSASVAAADQDHSMVAGANAFLAKPIEHRELFHEIGQLLQLRWVNNPLQPEAPLGDDLGPLIVPPPAEIEILRDLALAGNMRNIKKRAEHLAALDVQYRPFADKLRELARGYDSQAIMRLVEQSADLKQEVSP